MSRHVTDDLLRSFVDADVGEEMAVHIADHLDECPACATRAASLEPLATAFAAMEDPEPPPDLAASVLAAVQEPERLPIMEIGLGAGLLLSAALLTTAFGNPLGMAADVGVLISALGTMGRGLAAGLGSSQVVLAVGTVVALVGCLLTVRYASSLPLPRNDALRRIP
jgi:anti-sigma factor RsiW